MFWEINEKDDVKEYNYEIKFLIAEVLKFIAW
jgi:hypothetical protein